MMGAKRWYVVHSQPCREFKAQAQLQRQGFRTFLPRFAKTTRHARKLSTVSAALFPRYLFVELDVSRDRWRSVNGTIGVAGLVMGKELPTAVPSGIVESLLAACTADGFIDLSEKFGIGDRVRLLTGPFADLVGELARIDGAGRVTVLLQLLGGAVPVSVERAALMPAQAA
jgi:transcription elongation factor/antiterminator RfaH